MNTTKSPGQLLKGIFHSFQQFTDQNYEWESVASQFLALLPVLKVRVLTMGELTSALSGVAMPKEELLKRLNALLQSPAAAEEEGCVCGEINIRNCPIHANEEEPPATAQPVEEWEYAVGEMANINGWNRFGSQWFDKQLSRWFDLEDASYLFEPDEWVRRPKRPSSETGTPETDIMQRELEDKFGKCAQLSYASDKCADLERRLNEAQERVKELDDDQDFVKATQQNMSDIYAILSQAGYGDTPWLREGHGLPRLIADLATANAALKAQAEELEMERTHLNDVCFALGCDGPHETHSPADVASALTAKLKAAEEARHALEASARETRARVMVMGAQCRQMEHDLGAHKGALDRAKATITRLEGELDELEKDCKAIHKNWEEVCFERKKLQASLHASHGWRKISEHPPKAEDADDNENVLWNRKNGAGRWTPVIASWKAKMDFWMLIPPLPVEEVAGDGFSKARSAYLAERGRSDATLQGFEDGYKAALASVKGGKES